MCDDFIYKAYSIDTSTYYVCIYRSQFTHVMLELPTSWKYRELREDARRHIQLGTRREVRVQRRFPGTGRCNMEQSLIKGHFRVSQGKVRGAALFFFFNVYFK